MGFLRVASAAIIVSICPNISWGQTTTALAGQVIDSSGAVVSGATVTVREPATAFAVSRRTDADGRYAILSLAPGTYEVSVAAAGFRTAIIGQFTLDLGRTAVRDFTLLPAGVAESVVVSAETPLVDRVPVSPGHVVTGSTIQEIPLNGRHFIDLGTLVPASVAPSQNGFSSRPIRGVGALAFNVAGNREEAVGYVVNGVTTNNLTFGSLIFEPPLGSIEEIRIDTGSLAAEFGHVSGAIVSVATRSGGDRFRADAFTLFRDDALDARNFFELSSAEPAPFRRSQFGGTIGGPLWRGHTFFFATYEGFRQNQGVPMNSLVLSDEQRAGATNPTARALITLIPRANSFDADGTPRFVGWAPAVVDTDRWAIDVRHRIAAGHYIQGYFGAQHVRANEPGAQGNSIPGFGSVLRPYASILTLGDTTTFGSSAVNEARFGRSYLHGGTFPAAPLNPLDFGIRDGVTRPIGLPQIIVAGDLNFGGPGTLPQGRFDTSYVTNDTFTHVHGRETLKVGGEYRHFVNQNFAEGTGVFNVPSVSAFLAATANSFSTTLGERRSTIDERAVSAFVQDRVSINSRLTIDVGLRYEWHVTPTERDNKFVVFDPVTASLVRVGVDVEEIYRQNNRNVEPRVGLAYALAADGRTVAHAAYARTVDQPATTAVRDTAANPPWATPLTVSGSISLAAAVDATQPGGLAPATIDPAFQNAAVDSWSVSVQRQIASDLAVTAAYLGSHGSQLRISRNLNQPLDGVRPYPAVSLTSPIQPGTPLGNITQVESTGYSNYNALTLAATKRLSAGLQFDASYTWSKSLDTNSLNSSGFAVQDSTTIAGQYGLSDFDARHRVVVNAVYSLPFTGNAMVRGWQVAAVVQSQSGNPVNIVTSNASLNGSANTVRPDVTGPIRIIGQVDRWFDPNVFVAASHFGNLPRNAVIGPPFHNTDLTVTKNVQADGMRLQFRVDVFDLFNHANFASPGAIVGSPGFGKITRTRLPTGEAGSSRQVQLGIKLSF
jgi:hypothetical protein